MHTRNSSRSCIMAPFNTRLSAILIPNFLVSSCPNASFLPHNADTHLAISTRLFSPQQSGLLLLFSIHTSLNQEFQVLCPTSQPLLAVVKTSGSNSTSRRDELSPALLLGHGCWQGAGEHTAHAITLLEKLTLPAVTNLTICKRVFKCVTTGMFIKELPQEPPSMPQTPYTVLGPKWSR